jgi:hypothetical protein
VPCRTSRSRPRPDIGSVDPVPDPWITITIAAYGAVVATVALGWNIYTAWRDRVDIRVSFGPYNLNLGGYWIHPIMRILAANRGRRPVTLASYGFELTDGQWLGWLPFPIFPLPKRLEEGESYYNFVTVRSLQEAVQRLPTGVRIRALTFTTADGRQFRQRFGRRWQWHRLFRERLDPRPEHMEMLDPTGPYLEKLHALLGRSDDSSEAGSR